MARTTYLTAKQRYICKGENCIFLPVGGGERVAQCYYKPGGLVGQTWPWSCWERAVQKDCLPKERDPQQEEAQLPLAAEDDMG